jgi:hypothetical protein
VVQVVAFWHMMKLGCTVLEVPPALQGLPEVALVNVHVPFTAPFVIVPLLDVPKTSPAGGFAVRVSVLPDADLMVSVIVPVIWLVLVLLVSCALPLTPDMLGKHVFALINEKSLTVMGPEALPFVVLK